MRSWFIIIAALLVSPAFGDVVLLHDGTRIEGSIQREPGGWAVTDKAGKRTHVPDDKVASIEKSGTADPAAAADTKLRLLRRSVESLSDISQIIDRYSKFVEQAKGTPAAATAAKELQEWKDRQAKGLVKAGAAWVTPAEQAETLAKTATMLAEVRTLIKNAKFKEADLVVTKLLSANPDSAAALFLKGVVLFRLDQLGLAKKTFERVKELTPDHAPTLNNLAVIAWQQKQVPYALSLYDQAMLASPRNRLILDNVAEALGAIGDGERQTAVGKRVLKRFQDQDVELGKQLEQEGLKRWFGQYINKEQQAEVKRVQAKLSLLAEDYQKTRQRVTDIDSQLDANDRTMKRIIQDNTLWDSTTNTMIRQRLPRMYYELKRQNEALASERSRVLDTLETYKDREAAIYQEAPIKPYTGRHQIFEAEGTPLLPAYAPVTPTTQATTPP